MRLCFRRGGIDCVITGIMKSDRLFLNRFNLIRELGEGSYGLVVLARDIITDNQVALKIIQKSSILKMSHINRLRREINLLRLLKHPNIVRLYEVVETFDQMVLVMEYITGGDLFDLIIQSRRLDEDTARKIFRQLFSAIMYCHDNMMVHRDLKPENLLLDENNNLKIIDFGFVRTYSKDPQMTLKTYCGSLYYCAPEMIDGTPYPGPSSDIWSLGVILYVITNGYLPFRDSHLGDLYEALRAAKYDKGEYSSKECNQLIEKMIVANPNDRMDLSFLVSDPWLNDGYDTVPSPISGLTNDLLQFREEISNKIDILESQDSSMEKEMKRNSLQYLSLLIPIKDEELSLAPMPVMTESMSETREFSSAPSTIVGFFDKKSEQRKTTALPVHALISVTESKSSLNSSTPLSNSKSKSDKQDSIASLEKNQSIKSISEATIFQNNQEYSSAPNQDMYKVSNHMKGPSLKTRFFRWFHRADIPRYGVESKRFSFLGKSGTQ